MSSDSEHMAIMELFDELDKIYDTYGDYGSDAKLDKAIRSLVKEAYLQGIVTGRMGIANVG